MQSIAICFGQFGPYHHARVAALQEAGQQPDNKTAGQRNHGWKVVPIQIAAATSTYEWTEGDESRAAGKRCDGLKTLCEGVEEAASPVEVFLKARKLFREDKVDVAFLPSYSPARYFALFAAAKSLGIRTVMMNESHAGTEQATGWKRWIKRQIVKQFDAALVGGEPHKRHFASLGIPADKIFTGYDAVDNAHFAARADDIRAAANKSWQSTVGSSQSEKDESSKDQETKRQSVREAYGLPERYFLSLGRMVEKKNLSTLVEAYARFARASVETSKAETGNLNRSGAEIAEGKPELPETGDGGDPHTGGQAAAATKAENCKLKTEHCPPGLVFVGSGELEGTLREQASALGLRVIDRSDWKAGQSSHGLTRINTDGSERLAADRTEGNAASSVTRAGCGLSPETTGGEDAAATKTRHSLPATRDEENRGAVYFYGFRQIEENPVFYALAEAFVLPSLKEEWGLVVNEAMACSLPVIVSRTAGCAEDLLPGSESRQCSVGSIQSGEERKTEDRKLVADDSLEERSNGFVFDPKSSDALCEALRRIADPLNPKRSTLNAAAMGRRSREIVAKFSCENFARQALSAACAAQKA